MLLAIRNTKKITVNKNQSITARNPTPLTGIDFNRPKKEITNHSGTTFSLVTNTLTGIHISS